MLLTLSIYIVSYVVMCGEIEETRHKGGFRGFTPYVLERAVYPPSRASPGHPS
jgi:hypothetical protein